MTVDFLESPFHVDVGEADLTVEEDPDEPCYVVLSMSSTTDRLDETTGESQGNFYVYVLW